MAEISQPTPIKPAWPVSRDEPRKRKPSQSGDEEKKKKSPQPDSKKTPGDDGQTHIDDYA